MLQIENLVFNAWGRRFFDQATVTLPAGAKVGLVGRNGVGKTTLLETLMGNTRVMRGALRWCGEDITRWPAHRRVRAGLGWVPQEREVFPSLTVEENLTVIGRPGPWNLQRVYQFFPRLRERRGNYGNQLSGGEQQMLAIGRALIVNPKVLLLDEPTEGLAPIIVQELMTVLTRLVREERMSMIVVEQHARRILTITDQALILDRGMVVHSGPSAALLADSSVLERHVGVAGGRAASSGNVQAIDKLSR